MEVNMDSNDIEDIKKTISTMSEKEALELLSYMANEGYGSMDRGEGIRAGYYIRMLHTTLTKMNIQRLNVQDIDVDRDLVYLTDKTSTVGDSTKVKISAMPEKEVLSLLAYLANEGVEAIQRGDGRASGHYLSRIYKIVINRKIPQLNVNDIDVKGDVVYLGSDDNTCIAMSSEDIMANFRKERGLVATASAPMNFSNVGEESPDELTEEAKSYINSL